jgi:ClpP class serine protease
MPKAKHPIAQCAAQFAGPWAIQRGYALGSVMAALGAAMEEHGPQGPRADWLTEELKASGGFTWYLNPDGSTVSSLDQEFTTRIQQGAIAIVPLQGVMSKDAPAWLQRYGITSIRRFTADITRAAEDARVERIVIDAYTPGGMVYGTELASRAVRDAAQKKAVITHVNDLCASAGVYATVHSTRIMMGSRQASIGSIGTMTTVMNDQKFWSDWGIEWRDIYATDSKDKNAAYNEAVEGNTAKMVAELDKLNILFTGTVREARAGKLAAEEDVCTGKMYVGAEAVTCGLADGFATLQECIALTLPAKTDGEDIPPARSPDTQSIQTMSKIKEAALAVAAFFGFSKPTTEPNAEQLEQANAALKEAGIEGATMVTASTAKQLDELPTLRQQVAELEQKLDASQNALTSAQAEVAKANAEAEKVKETITATLKEHGVELAADADPVAVACTTLKEWAGKAGDQHTASEASAPDGKVSKTYPSLKLAASKGLRSTTEGAAAK